MTPLHESKHASTGALATLLVAVTLAPVGCRESPTQTQPAASSSVPVDHLAPREQNSTEARYLGFRPPEGMVLDARFPAEVHLVGNISQQEAAKEMRDQLHVSHVNLDGTKIIFPNATRRDGDPHRSFRIEVTRGAGKTHVLIRETTRRVSKEKLTTEQALRRAGLSPDGKPLNTKSIE